MANRAGTSGPIRHTIDVAMSPLSGRDAQRTAPIACSLGTRDLGIQEHRWTELMRHAGTGRVATPEGVTLTFRSGPDVERELRELVAVENDCCSWTRWEVETDGDGALVMDARTTGDGVHVLQSMFCRLSAAAA
jgi:hypothetical protein